MSLIYVAHMSRVTHELSHVWVVWHVSRVAHESCHISVVPNGHINESCRVWMSPITCVFRHFTLSCVTLLQLQFLPPKNNLQIWVWCVCVFLIFFSNGPNTSSWTLLHTNHNETGPFSATLTAMWRSECILLCVSNEYAASASCTASLSPQKGTIFFRAYSYRYMSPHIHRYLHIWMDTDILPFRATFGNPKCF